MSMELATIFPGNLQDVMMVDDILIVIYKYSVDGALHNCDMMVFDILNLKNNMLMCTLLSLMSKLGLMFMELLCRLLRMTRNFVTDIDFEGLGSGS